MNNFLTNIKLLIALKDLGIDRCKTTKARSRYPTELLKIDKLSIKRDNQITKLHIIAANDDFCFIWQDLKTTQIMTTIYFANVLDFLVFIFKEKHCGIPANLIIQEPNRDYFALPIPVPILKYNKHMESSNANSQVQSYDLANIQSFGYQQLLFKPILDAAMLNSFYLYKILKPELMLSYVDFRHIIAICLIQNPFDFG